MKGSDNMNHNIEVINENLWSIRFSLIPFINEIDYEEDITEHNHFFLTNNGIVVLNQDNKLYPHLKVIYLKLIKRSNLMLKSKLKKLNNKKERSHVELMTSAAIRLILESRKLR
jgi:hypothetical protein